MPDSRFYWVGPELLAKGERSRRQLAAMSSLAGAPTKMVRNYGDYAQRESGENAMVAQLQSRLGVSEQKVQAQAAPQNSMYQGMLGPLPPPSANEATGGTSNQDMVAQQPTTTVGTEEVANARRSTHSDASGGATLGDFARAAAATITGAYIPKASREADIARMQGTVQGRQDQMALGKSLGSYWGRMAHPEAAVQGLYPWAPYLAQPTVPPRQPAMTAAGIAWQAGGGDPMKAAEIYRGMHPVPPPFEETTETADVDPATGQPLGKIDLALKGGVKRVTKTRGPAGSARTRHAGPEAPSVVEGVAIGPPPSR